MRTASTTGLDSGAPPKERGRLVVGWRRAIGFSAVLCLLTALLLLAIFPKWDVHWLAPVALTPLLVAAARTRSALLRFVMGWAAGIFYWFFLCTWIQFVLEAHGDMGTFGSWGAFLLFCVLKALHLAVFTMLAGPLMRRWYAVPAVAALWTGWERTHATFGFAWLDLGNAGIDMAVPLRVAPWVGVYGVSFVLAMLSAALAAVLVQRNRKVLWPLAALVLLLVLPPIPQGVKAERSALVVQPNIDPAATWTALDRDRTQRRLELLSRSVTAPLVIWPELPAPLYFYEDRDFHETALGIARHGSAFLFGTVAYNGVHQPLNSAVLLRPDGSEAGRYDKIELVPFGEFVPAVFSFVNRISQEIGDFVPGRDVKVLTTPGERIGAFICYESAFPDLVRQFARQGAGVLVNLSNDAYFGRSEARLQHLSLVRMRAVENRRFVVRSTDDGITAVVDPAGRIRQQLEPYRELAARMRYGQVEETTFYSRHGDWFAWSCLVAGTGLALRPGRARVRT